MNVDGSFVLVGPFQLGTKLGLGPPAIVAPHALFHAVRPGGFGIEPDGRFHLFAWGHVIVPDYYES